MKPNPNNGNCPHCGGDLLLPERSEMDLAKAMGLELGRVDYCPYCGCRVYETIVPMREEYAMHRPYHRGLGM